MLIHLHVCEGIDSVIGEEEQMRKRLIKFEIDKFNEINEYSKNLCSPKCIKFMHERIQTIMKFLQTDLRGVFPFKYGQEVHKNMTDIELKYVSSFWSKDLQKRLDAI